MPKQRYFVQNAGFVGLVVILYSEIKVISVYFEIGVTIPNIFNAYVVLIDIRTSVENSSYQHVRNNFNLYNKALLLFICSLWLAKRLNRIV